MKRRPPDFAWTPPVMPFDILVDGFEKACERFHENRHSDQRGAASGPLFEALNWAVALHDRLGDGHRWTDAYEHGDTILGLRFARNTVHHDGTLIMLWSRYRPGGHFSFEDQPEWRWQAPHMLPWKRSPYFEDEYEDCLMGQLVVLSGSGSTPT